MDIGGGSLSFIQKIKVGRKKRDSSNRVANSNGDCKHIGGNGIRYTQR